MKTKILTIVFLIAAFATYATVRTVSNHPLGGAQYATLQAAYAAASTGDTLIVTGTNIQYQNSVAWGKSLVVIGSGFNAAKQTFKYSTISWTPGHGLGFVMGPPSSGSKFYGIYFDGGVDFNDGTYSNLTFEDCSFWKAASQVSVDFHNNPATNIVFRNCIFYPDNGINLKLPNGPTTTVSVQNCVLAGYIEGQNSENNTVLIDHCLFLQTSANMLENLRNSSVTNCIFMNNASIANNLSNCNFLNNIARLNVTFPPAGNTGSGNLSNTDPNFVNYTLGTTYSETHDYHLQPGSPAIGAATDLTDIGVHGGFTKFSEKGEPLNTPVMRSMVIQNTSVAPNGIMHVQIEASKPIDN